MGAFFEALRTRGEFRLRRLFSAFPGGFPGFALLLLRAVLGMALMLQAGCYFRVEDPSPAYWLMGLAAAATGILLLIGFLTPIAGMLVTAGAIGVALSLLPACASTLFESKPAIVFAGTILIASALLGPGAISVDARMFGRREIIIPPLHPRSPR